MLAQLPFKHRKAGLAMCLRYSLPSDEGASSGCLPHLGPCLRHVVCTHLGCAKFRLEDGMRLLKLISTGPVTGLDAQRDGRRQIGDKDQEQDLKRCSHDLSRAVVYLFSAHEASSPRRRDANDDADEDLHHLHSRLQTLTKVNFHPSPRLRRFADPGLRNVHRHDKGHELLDSGIDRPTLLHLTPALPAL